MHMYNILVKSHAISSRRI